MAQMMIDIPDEFVHLFENNEVIELVNRAANGRFSEFLKVAVKELPKDNSEELLKAVMNTSSLAALSSTASLLATGVGFANLAVSIAGFKMMSDKLNVISKNLEIVKECVDKVNDKLKYQFFEEKLDVLDSETLKIISAITDNKIVAQEKFSSVIEKYQHYFYNIYNRRDDVELEEYLRIYYDLIPIYVNLVVIYYQMGYEELIGKKDVLHEKWIDVFDKNTSSTFMQTMQDYYFIDKQWPNKEVNLFMRNHLDSNQAMLMQIEDTVTLMKYVKTAEGYQKFMDAVQKSATKKAKEELAPELYKVCSKEKAEQILEKAAA